MPNICFISWKKKRGRKKPADFPASPPLRALWMGVFQTPVHIQHSRGERRAQGVMHPRNVVPQSSHSIKAECELFAFARTRAHARTGYYCTCVRHNLLSEETPASHKSTSDPHSSDFLLIFGWFWQSRRTCWGYPHQEEGILHNVKGRKTLQCHSCGAFTNRRHSWFSHFIENDHRVTSIFYQSPLKAKLGDTAEISAAQWLPGWFQ